MTETYSMSVERVAVQAYQPEIVTATGTYSMSAEHVAVQRLQVVQIQQHATTILQRHAKMDHVNIVHVPTAAECLTEMGQRVTEYVGLVMTTHLVMVAPMQLLRTTILQ